MLYYDNCCIYYDHSIFIQYIVIQKERSKPKTKKKKKRNKVKENAVCINVYFISAGVRAWTILVPSLNLVLKIRFAFWNMPSLRETTINWEPLNLVLINRPIFCVCDRSRAASISSRIYIGAGLNWSSAMINDIAIRELFRRNSLVKAKLDDSNRKVSLTVVHHSIP